MLPIAIVTASYRRGPLAGVIPFTLLWEVITRQAPNQTLLLLGVVRMENAGRVAPLRFSLLCGGASYAIYLSHTLVLTVTQHLGLNAWLRGTSPSLVRVTFIALSLFILALSALHYRQIERRLHGVFRRWLGVQPLRPPQR